MLSAALLLLSNSLFLSLRLTGNPGSFPRPLPPEEERACLERWAQGDLEARNRLVEHNLRLVAHIIKKYYTQADNQEDLISIGTIGLIKAVNTFRADRGIKLATYASRCIENEILMYFRSQRKLQGEVSLSDAIDTDKEGGSLYLLDVVGADDTMLSDLQDREEQLLLRRLVRDCLTEREADIIRRIYQRYLRGCTLRQIKKELEQENIPAAGGGGIRHEPQLCLPHREAGAGEAGKGAAKGVGG